MNHQPENLTVMKKNNKAYISQALISAMLLVVLSS
jgi:hypothetical protein